MKRSKFTDEQIFAITVDDPNRCCNALVITAG
jgi:hypothetical protein